MFEKKLSGKIFAILATDGFEQSELLEPRRALEDAGAEVEIVSLKNQPIKSWDGENWGRTIDVDTTVDEARADRYDGLVLPGGVMNPDKLRMNPQAVEFVASFTTQGKPIAAICHGPWTLIETNFLAGKTLTSWPSLKTDLINAGAHWVDQDVVVNSGLITSRKPEDLPAFTDKMVEQFSQSETPDETTPKGFAKNTVAPHILH